MKVKAITRSTGQDQIKLSALKELRSAHASSYLHYGKFFAGDIFDFVTGGAALLEVIPKMVRLQAP